MADQKEFTCKECGETFDSLADIGHHARETGHVNKKSPKIQRGGQGTPKTDSLLSPDDLLELKEKEKLIRMKELELREATLDAKLMALKNSGSGNNKENGPRERTWRLPDGVIFQGTSKDYREMLETYYAANPKNASPNNTEESFALKLLDLYRKDVDEKVSSLSYSPFDALDRTLSDISKVAPKVGFGPSNMQNPSDKMRMDLYETELGAVNKAIDRVSEHMSRAESDRRLMLKLVQNELVSNPELKKRLFPNLGKRSPQDQESYDPAEFPRTPMTEEEADELMRNMHVSRKPVTQ